MSGIANPTMTVQPLPIPSNEVSSLLSLSIVAANAAPINLSAATGSGNSSSSTTSSHTSSSAPLSVSIGTGVKQHRRLASTGKARRRLSDARDAANRLSPAAMQMAAAALSLASLSLTPSSPPMNPGGSLSTAVPPMASMTIPNSESGNTKPAPIDDETNSTPLTAVVDGPKESNTTPIPISGGKNGKKRGMDHKCESCSKIYRHPSCLIKHRWEHTPHWREASKFVLSKHQQVQLLEAAAILSHLSPSSSTGTSLPEDRSLWPSFLSGGSLPPPEGFMPTVTITASASASASQYSLHPTSSSVPASAILGNFQRAPSTGPRLHDYPISTSTSGPGSVTQVRAGLIGVPAGSGGVTVPTPPMAVPNANGNSPTDAFVEYRSAVSDFWTSSRFANGTVSSSYQSVGNSSLPYSDERSGSVSTGAGGWSLPRSSLRSVSASSRSRSGSASGSRSDESVFVDVDEGADLDEHAAHGYGRYGYGFSSRTMAWKKEEDELSIGFSVREEDEDDGMIVGPISQRKEAEWDGMEMDMDMDMD